MWIELEPQDQKLYENARYLMNDPKYGHWLLRYLISLDAGCTQEKLANGAKVLSYILEAARNGNSSNDSLRANSDLCGLDLASLLAH